MDFPRFFSSIWTLRYTSIMNKLLRLWRRIMKGKLLCEGTCNYFISYPDVNSEVTRAIRGIPPQKGDCDRKSNWSFAAIPSCFVSSNTKSSKIFVLLNAGETKVETKTRSVGWTAARWNLYLHYITTPDNTIISHYRCSLRSSDKNKNKNNIFSTLSEYYIHVRIVFDNNDCFRDVRRPYRRKIK